MSEKLNKSHKNGQAQLDLAEIAVGAAAIALYSARAKARGVGGGDESHIEHLIEWVVDFLNDPDPKTRLSATHILETLGSVAAQAAPALAERFSEEPWELEESWDIHSAALHALLRIGQNNLSAFKEGSELLRFLSGPEEQGLCEIYVEAHHVGGEERYDILVISISDPGSMACTALCLTSLGFNIEECELVPLERGKRERRSVKSFSARRKNRGQAPDDLKRELEEKLGSIHKALRLNKGKFIRTLNIALQEALTSDAFSSNVTPSLSIDSQAPTGGPDRGETNALDSGVEGRVTSAKEARAIANDYILLRYPNMLVGGNAYLLPEESRWVVSIALTSPNFGQVGDVGVVSIDSRTGEIVSATPPSEAESLAENLSTYRHEILEAAFRRTGIFRIG